MAMRHQRRRDIRSLIMLPCSPSCAPRLDLIIGQTLRRTTSQATGPEENIMLTGQANGGGAKVTGQRAILEQVFKKTMQYMDKQIPGVFSSPP